jgi:hypothetical protein
MPELSKDAISLLTYLLPGFLAAWVFYGLTAHIKPSQFERTVQALIFTLFIHTLMPAVEWGLKGVGRHLPLGSWGRSAELATSIYIATFFGLLLAYLANTDKFHKKLRDAGFSTRTSHPSEWFCVLSKKRSYVILHLNDHRRLYGWPKEWPAYPDNGFFYIIEPSWITEDNSILSLTVLDGLLINVRDVKWVEFLNTSLKQ